MLPDPLHPALVHFPIVLALLAPFCALGILAAIGMGRASVRAWIGVLALQTLVATTGWLAAEAGEEEEERVERIVDEDFIEEHEEAAEWFLWIAGAIVPIAAIGLLDGRIAAGARALTVVGGLVAAVAVARVGHTGGALVYDHGAALAYLKGESAVEALGRAAVARILSGGERESNGTDERDR